MNKLYATVTKIESVDHLNMVYFDLSGQTLSMMSLDLNEAIKVGAKVELTSKPSHVAVAKELRGQLSFTNQLNAKIHSLDNGKLLTTLSLDIEGSFLEAIITAESSEAMTLKVDDEITALINASELSILKVL